MGGTGRANASIQAYLTPITSPAKPSSIVPNGDGFTAEEVQAALRPEAPEPWHPNEDYADCEISDLYAGPRAVTFSGRVANIFDSANTPKTPRSAKGCVKLCVKDGSSAITVISSDQLHVCVCGSMCFADIYRFAFGTQNKSRASSSGTLSPSGPTTVSSFDIYLLLRS